MVRDVHLIFAHVAKQVVAIVHAPPSTFFPLRPYVLFEHNGRDGRPPINSLRNGSIAAPIFHLIFREVFVNSD